jgi:hypothetical protein
MQERRVRPNLWRVWRPEKSAAPAHRTLRPVLGHYQPPQEPEVLFARCIERVRTKAVPVVEEPNLKPLGRCHHDKIILRSGMHMPLRLWVLMHELAHLYLHQPRHGGTSRAKDEQEFEADWVAQVLYTRYGFGPKYPTGPTRSTYEPIEVLMRHGAHFYQARVDRAVERIWKLLQE